MTHVDTHLVSVLIATRNREASLRGLVDRLTTLFCSELSAGTAEIVVFDDASTDATRAVCHEYPVRYEAVERSVGLIEARRRLMRMARGAYLLQLDDDSRPLDGAALDRIRTVFGRRGSCAIIACNIASPTAPRGLAAPESSIAPLNSFIGCGVALRADVARSIGSYPPFLAGYGAEEIALSLLVLDRGLDILLDPRLRVYHAQDGSGRIEGRRRGEAFVNESATLVALFPWFLVLPVLGYKTASYLLYNTRQGTLLSFLRVQTELPPRLWQAARWRRPVRLSTIRRFYALRRACRSRPRSHGDADDAVAWFEPAPVIGQGR